MGDFIQNNSIWFIPIISIVFTIVIKISSKPEFLTLNYIDYLDFGFDLSISSIICLVSQIQNETSIWMLFVSFLIVFITSTIVNRIGWDKKEQERKLVGVLLPDIIGLFLLIIVTLHIGGIIK